MTAEWICPRCNIMMRFKTVDMAYSRYIGVYPYIYPNYECPLCHLHSAIADQTNSKYNNQMYCHQKHTELLLRKNYPPSEFEYLTIKEALKVYKGKIKKKWLTFINPTPFYILNSNNERIFLKKSLELYANKIEPCFGHFNIQRQDDFPLSFKAEQEELLKQYLPPDKYPYISEEELLRRDAKDNELGFDPDRVKFFVHSMEQNGKQIYLERSWVEYRDYYNGLFDIVTYWKYGDEDEEEEDEQYCNY